MTKEEFAKKYGFGTFREGLLNTLDYTLDQLEFTEEEKVDEVNKLEAVIKNYEQQVTEKFKNQFSDEEVVAINAYLSQPTPDYMEKFSDVHADLNDEFGTAILEQLEAEADSEEE